MNIIDSHAHLTIDGVYEDIHSILHKAQANKLSAIINICVDKTSLHRGLELAQTFPGYIFNTAATTPHDVDKDGADFFEDVLQAVKNNELVGIGETGLDYYYEHSSKENQIHYLKKYAHLALKYKLPLVIHCRDAFKDFFEIMDLEYTRQGKHAPLVLHCFTGTKEEAKQVLDRGWFISISGIVTFKKSIWLQDIARYVPLDKLFVETDTPYLAPAPYRGKRNEPSYILKTLEMIAHLKKIPIDAVQESTVKNIKQLFSINPREIL